MRYLNNEIEHLLPNDLIDPMQKRLPDNGLSNAPHINFNDQAFYQKIQPLLAKEGIKLPYPLAANWRETLYKRVLEFLQKPIDSNVLALIIQDATQCNAAHFLFQESNEHGRNALLVALMEKSANLPDLLNALNFLSQSDRNTVLQHTAKNGWNALILTCRYSLEALRSLVPLITELLNIEEQATMVKQTSVNGWNALMIACRYNPNALSSLIPLITALNIEEQATMVKQVNANGSNALMLVANYNPTIVPRLLEVIETFSHEMQAQILNQSFSDKATYKQIREHIKNRHQTFFDSIKLSLDALLSATPNPATALAQRLKNTQPLARIFRADVVELLIHALNTITPPKMEHVLKIYAQLNAGEQKKVRDSSKKGSNILMITCETNPEALSSLVPLITALDRQEQITILKQTTADGSNALMLACRYNPNALDSLIPLITALNIEEQATMMKQTAADGSNALMLACRYSPKALDSLIPLVTALNIEEQATMMKQTTADDSNADGSNALMLACRYSPKALDSLIPLITALNIEEQATLLKQTIADGWNALMLTCCYNPNALDSLIPLITALNIEEQATMVKQTAPDGWNALMLACRYNPKALDSLIPLITALNIEEQATIVKQTTADGANALMIACNYNPNALDSLIPLITALNIEEQATIVKQTNADGWNALMIACNYNPNALDSLIPLITALNIEEQATIVKQTNADGWNALMLACYYNPNVLDLLIPLITALNIEEQATIVKQTNADGWNALMLAAKYHPTITPLLLELIETFAHEMQAQIINQSFSHKATHTQIIEHIQNRHQTLFNSIKLPLHTLLSATTNPATALAQRLKNPQPLAMLFRADVVKLLMHALNTITVHKMKHVLKIYAQLHAGEQKKVCDSSCGFFLTIASKTANELENFLKSSTAEQLSLYFKQKSKDDNPFLYAIKYHPEAIAPLLHAIQLLTIHEQSAVLQQTDSKGCNALMLAAAYRPQCFDDLLAVINCFAVQDQAAILTQTDHQRRNVLLCISLESASLVNRLLNFMRLLDHKEQATILTQARYDGVNILMRSTRHPRAIDNIPPLLDAINTLTIDEQITILRQRDDKECNLLSEVISYPEKHVKILEWIMAHPPEEQIKIINHDLNMQPLLANIKCYEQQRDTIVTQNSERSGIICNALHQIQLIVTLKQYELLAPKNANAALAAIQTRALFIEYNHYVHDEQKWCYIPALLAQAGQKFCHNKNMLGLISQLSNNFAHHQRMQANKKNYDLFSQHFANVPSTLSHDQQLHYLITKTDGHTPLAHCFLTMTHDANMHNTEQLTIMVALIKTFSQAQQHYIVEQAMSSLSQVEQNKLNTELNELDKNRLQQQIAGLIDSTTEHKTIPSAPTEEPIEVTALPSNLPTGSQEISFPHPINNNTLLNQALYNGQVINDETIEALIIDVERMSAKEWVTQLNHAPEPATVLCESISLLPPTEQNEIIQCMQQYHSFNKIKWAAELQKKPLALRSFLLMELAEKINTPFLNDKERADLHYLHQQLLTLVGIEHHPHTVEKQYQINELWHDFLKTFRKKITSSSLMHTLLPKSILLNTASTNLFDALTAIQQHPSFNPEREKQNIISSQKPSPATGYSQVIRSGEKELFSAAQQKNDETALMHILNKNDERHLIYSEKNHNALSLMFKMKHSALHLLVPKIALLEPKNRQSVLNVCSKNNITLINPTSYIAQTFKNNLAAKQDLYVLELERIILTMKADDPAKSKLQALHQELSELDNIHTNEQAKNHWIYAIQGIRKDAHIVQKRGILNWLKNALGFTKTENITGYGIGLFKPSLNTLFNEMTTLPFQCIKK